MVMSQEAVIKVGIAMNLRPSNAYIHYIIILYKIIVCNLFKINNKSII